jgi:hypothetical protein
MRFQMCGKEGSRGGAMIFQIGLDLEHGFRPKYLHEQAEAPYRTAA